MEYRRDVGSQRGPRAAARLLASQLPQFSGPKAPPPSRHASYAGKGGKGRPDVIVKGRDGRVLAARKIVPLKQHLEKGAMPPPSLTRSDLHRLRTLTRERRIARLQSSVPDAVSRLIDELKEISALPSRAKEEDLMQMLQSSDYLKDDVERVYLNLKEPSKVAKLRWKDFNAGALDAKYVLSHFVKELTAQQLSS